MQKQTDKIKKQEKLQKITLGVPEAARAICRKILDHKGISETTVYSGIILIRSGKFIDCGLFAYSWGFDFMDAYVFSFSKKDTCVPLSKYVFCREGKFVRRASHK